MRLSDLATSRRWPYRLLRIGALAGLGWWAAQATILAEQSSLPFEREWPRTDFARKVVQLDEIESGGPPKDGIPAIDKPQFVRARDADRWLDAREPVIALEVNRDARAYPLQILIYHEIVNDRVGGIPVAVTFCPLCNASIVFDRRTSGGELDFGTTGKLRKSDLVMYDRQSESWWQQFTGRGIVGRYAGVELRRVSSQIVAYADFKTEYPEGKILSRATGHLRPYGRNPYRGYDRVDNMPFLFFDPVDPRLPAMERVLSVTIEGRQRIYPFSAFSERPVINDELAGQPIVVFSKPGTLSALDDAAIAKSRMVPSATAFARGVEGKILRFEMRDGAFRDLETGSRWNLFGRAVDGPFKGRQLGALETGVHFAFAWLAFNPESDIYGRRGDAHQRKAGQSRP